ASLRGRLAPAAPETRHSRSRPAGDSWHRPGPQAGALAPLRDAQGDRTRLRRRSRAGAGDQCGNRPQGLRFPALMVADHRCRIVGAAWNTGPGCLVRSPSLRLPQYSPPPQVDASPSAVFCPLMTMVTHPPSPARRISVPNLLTYARMAAVPVVIGSMYWSDFLGGGLWLHWVALAVFIAAGVTDFFDGYFPPVWGQQTTFGRMLDPIAHKLLVASCLPL